MPHARKLDDEINRRIAIDREAAAAVLRSRVEGLGVELDNVIWETMERLAERVAANQAGVQDVAELAALIARIREQTEDESKTFTAVSPHVPVHDEFVRDAIRVEQISNASEDLVRKHIQLALLAAERRKEQAAGQEDADSPQSP